MRTAIYAMMTSPCWPSKFDEGGPKRSGEIIVKLEGKAATVRDRRLMDDGRDSCACACVKSKSAKVSGRGNILNLIRAEL